MEMFKKLIITVAFAASLMPVLPLYAMETRAEDGDSIHDEETKEAMGVCAPGAIDLPLIQRRRDALTAEARGNLDDELLRVIQDDGLSEQEKVDKVRGFLGLGANPNAIGEQFGRTALLLSMDCPGLALMHLLLDYGADANMESEEEYERTALMCAIDTDRVDQAEALLARRADVNLPSGDQTLLMRAIGMCNTEMVELFLSKGVDVNAKNRHGTTALWLAMHCNKRADKLRLLILADADTSIPLPWNDQGISALRERYKVLGEIGLCEDVVSPDGTLLRLLPRDLSKIVQGYLFPGAIDAAVGRLITAQIADQSEQARAERKALAMSAADDGIWMPKLKLRQEKSFCLKVVVGVIRAITLFDSYVDRLSSATVAFYTQVLYSLTH